MLTLERLYETLQYDPATGLFTWRVQLSNRIKAGSIAGRITKEGYREIRIDGRYYRGARLAWFYVTGAWPKGMIDHMYGVRHDDRFSELRDATNSQNQQNRAGVSGVAIRKGWYEATIQIDGRLQYLGRAGTYPEARDLFNG